MMFPAGGRARQEARVTESVARRNAPWEGKRGVLENTA